jgi:hypothetical protein
MIYAPLGIMLKPSVMDNTHFRHRKFKWLKIALLTLTHPRLDQTSHAAIAIIK